MKITTGNIGIKNLAITKMGIGVRGNSEFTEWASKGMRLKKMRLSGENRVFTFEQGDGGPTPRDGSWIGHWTSKSNKHPPIRDFGATEPIEVRLTPAAGLEVVMPPVEKCKKPLRPNGQWRVKARKAELEARRFKPAVPEKVAEATPSESLVDTTTHDDMSLRQAIKLVNAYKQELGDDLELSITSDGKIKAAMVYV